MREPGATETSNFDGQPPTRTLTSGRQHIHHSVYNLMLRLRSA